MHKFIFLDTNVFEHFPPLSNIDWLKLAACNSATLVVPQITIRELNRHKDLSDKARQKRRAANALKELSQWSRFTGPASIRPSVDLIFWANEPLIDFRSVRLSSDVPDDRLLASAMEFAQEKQLGPESVLVASADVGLDLKGRTQPSIQMLPMDDALRLPDEMDAEEKRTKDLENRLRQLTSQIPQLSLTIDSEGKNFTERRLYDRQLPIDEAEITERLREVRAEYPYLQCETPCPPPGWSFYRRADKEELDQYNKKLHQFFGRYDRFLRKHIEVTNWQARTRSLQLTLNNTGNKPAEDIDIAITFPAGIDIISDDDFKALPAVPMPPDKPGEDTEPEHSIPERSGDPSQVSNSKILEFIKSTSHGFQVKLFVQRLKHTFSESLPLLDFHFPLAAELRSFQFRYRIVAGNCPEPFEGVLNVKITVVADTEFVESDKGGPKGMDGVHKNMSKAPK